MHPGAITNISIQTRTIIHWMHTVSDVCSERKQILVCSGLIRKSLGPFTLTYHSIAGLHFVFSHDLGSLCSLFAFDHPRRIIHHVQVIRGPCQLSRAAFARC